MTKAVVFVQTDRLHADAARCLDHCAAKRYDVAGLICGDREAALRMLGDGLATVVVVPSNAEAGLLPGAEVAPRRNPGRRNTARRNAGYGPRLVAH